MSNFSVKIDRIESENTNISTCKTEVYQLVPNLIIIKNGVSLGDATDEIKRKIAKFQEQIENESVKLGELSEILSSVLTQYITTENKLLGNETASAPVQSEKSNNGITGNTPNESDVPETKLDFDEKIAETLGISEDNWEVIKLVLGFIPGINCLVDIYQIVDDLNEALCDDGKISLGEAGALVADFFFLALDVVSFMSIVKQAGKAVKSVKQAKTMAKVAAESSDKALQAAEKAVQAAEKAAAKSGGTVATTKAAQKVEKAVNTAIKKVAKAEKAVDAAEEASKTVKVAVKNAKKEVTNAFFKGTGENIVQEYIPGKNKRMMPTSKERELRDNLLNQDDTTIDDLKLIWE